MRRLIVVIVAGLLGMTGARAQEGPGGREVRQTATALCPPSGYSPPYYAMFGQNGGDGPTAYEIASPCIGKDVREVAEAIGMGRNKLLGVKNVITIMFSAKGTMADAGGMAKLSKADFHMAYHLPAVRMFLNGTRADGTPLKEIRVFADQYAWNEAEEGRGATPAMSALNDRAPLLKLTPFGAMWSIIEAEGHAVVGKRADGKTVLTGTSRYDGIEVSVTVDDQHHNVGPYTVDDTIRLPIEVTAKANGHVYGATFADYRDDMEPNAWVLFPRLIKWTLDGTPLADLTVTYFRSNPYVVFPVPDVVKRKAASHEATHGHRKD